MLHIQGATLFYDGPTREVPVDDMRAVIAELEPLAVIFDCDGTLVESARAHLKCMQFAAARQGQTMLDDWYMQRTGLDRKSLFAAFAAQNGTEFNVARAIEDSIKAFAQFLGEVRPIRETIDLMRHLSAVGIPIAIGTNAEAEVARQSLAAVGLADCYQELVSISDGCPPKPDPAIFNLAARRLGICPHRIVVVEDSPQGYEAARRANMKVLILKMGTSHC